VATISYAQSAVPDPYRILGLRLKPFSLGHYLLLQRFGCAFVQEAEGSATRDDLIMGVLVCSMSHDEFLEFIEQKDFVKQTVAWGKKVGVVDLTEKAKLFQAYLRQGLTEPDYIALHPQNDASNDWVQNLKITLVTRLGHSEHEALDMPLSKALADYYKLAENEGMIRLLSAEDRAAAEANSLAMAEMAARRTDATGEGAWP
jgi:hypothetical protein